MAVALCAHQSETHHYLDPKKYPATQIWSHLTRLGPAFDHSLLVVSFLYCTAFQILGLASSFNEDTYLDARCLYALNVWSTASEHVLTGLPRPTVQVLPCSTPKLLNSVSLQVNSRPLRSPTAPPSPTSPTSASEMRGPLLSAVISNPADRP